MMNMPIIIGGTCPLCGREHSVTVEFTDYLFWDEGTPAQEAFPYLTPSEREQLISGFCQKCQRKIFKDF